MKVDVMTLDAGSAGSVDLSDAIFGLEPRKDILHRAVTWQLAKRRAGTHKSQSRGEVTATTKKFLRQKGSGGARHGDKKVPQFRGGAKAHGPVVRSHEHDLPKKVRKLALRHALSAKVKDQEIAVLDAASLTEPKTKALKAQLDKLGWSDALVVDATPDRNFLLASRNIPKIDVLPVAGLNVYDILRRGRLVLTKTALEQIEARLA